MDRRRSGGWRAAALALVALVPAAACGGDDDGAVPQTGVPETTATTAATAADAIEILVTNDDGYDAEGIDALVEALRQVEGVEVTVVAPATQQSGTGGSTTEGELTRTVGTTRSGFDATLVEGFPADAVRVAFDDLRLTPDLVVSGINQGQNLGPVVDVSGTVGAARAAVRRGVPAIAASQGLQATPDDYAAAADLVVTWIEDNRDAIAGDEMPTDAVTNLNVPTCTAGEVRGTVEVASATGGDALAPSDCTSTATGFSDDVTAFVNGYATITEVGVEPAATAAAA